MTTDNVPTAAGEPAAAPVVGRVVVVAIATPIEAALVTRTESVDDRLEVLYRPDLLPPPRYPCDHRGIDSFRRTPEDERKWTTMLARAEVLLGLAGDSTHTGRRRPDKHATEVGPGDRGRCRRADSRVRPHR